MVLHFCSARFKSSNHTLRTTYNLGYLSYSWYYFYLVLQKWKSHKYIYACIYICHLLLPVNLFFASDISFVEIGFFRKIINLGRFVLCASIAPIHVVRTHSWSRVFFVVRTSETHLCTFLGHPFLKIFPHTDQHPGDIKTLITIMPSSYGVCSNT